MTTLAEAARYLGPGLHELEAPLELHGSLLGSPHAATRLALAPGAGAAVPCLVRVAGAAGVMISNLNLACDAAERVAEGVLLVEDCDDVVIDHVSVAAALSASGAPPGARGPPCIRVRRCRRVRIAGCAVRSSCGPGVAVQCAPVAPGGGDSPPWLMEVHDCTFEGCPGGVAAYDAPPGGGCEPGRDALVFARNLVHASVPPSGVSGLESMFRVALGDGGMAASGPLVRVTECVLSAYAELPPGALPPDALPPPAPAPPGAVLLGYNLAIAGGGGINGSGNFGDGTNAWVDPAALQQQAPGSAAAACWPALAAAMHARTRHAALLPPPPQAQKAVRLSSARPGDLEWLAANRAGFTYVFALEAPLEDLLLPSGLDVRGTVILHGRGWRSAVVRAEDGAQPLVRVHPGGSLLASNVALEGIGGAAVIEAAEGALVHLRACAVQGGGAAAAECAACVLAASGACVVADRCVLSGANACVAAAGAAAVVVNHSFLADFHACGVRAAGGCGVVAVTGCVVGDSDLGPAGRAVLPLGAAGVDCEAAGACLVACNVFSAVTWAARVRSPPGGACVAYGNAVSRPARALAAAFASADSPFDLTPAARVARGHNEEDLVALVATAPAGL
jgi:hypothetical protein